MNELKDPVKLFNVSHTNPGAPIKYKDGIAFKVPTQGEYVVVERNIAEFVVSNLLWRNEEGKRVPRFRIGEAAEQPVQPVNQALETTIKRQNEQIQELQAQLAQLLDAKDEEAETESEDSDPDNDESDEEEDSSDEDEKKTPRKRGRKKSS